MKTLILGLGLFLMIPLFGATTAPQRIVLGADQAARSQVWILELADSFYLKLGPQAQPLRAAFPSIPYPLRFIEITMRKNGNCQNILDCDAQGIIHIQSITSLNGKYPAEVHYRVDRSDATKTVLKVEATYLTDTTQTANLTLEFANSAVRID